jgi:excisionase family DNA binding protein
MPCTAPDRRAKDRHPAGRQPALQRVPGGHPRLALSPDEAAGALGVSRDFLDEHVMPELRVVRRGRRRLIPVRELERWLEIAGCRLLDQR